MAYQVVWSDNAYADIDQIASYVARDSPYHAERLVQRIIDRSRSLDQFPLRGRVVPEMGDDAVRELFVSSYRLIYEIKQQQVQILAVIHTARQIDNVLPR